jgi:hypothetical protein
MTPQDPMQAAPAGAMPEESAAKFTIEISAMEGGSCTVAVESAAQEASEGSPEGEAAEAAPVQVNSIKEALSLALEIYRNGGQMPSSDTTNLEAGFNSNG